MQLIIGLISSGALGFVNYSIIQDRGFISAYEEVNNKRAKLIIFTLIDYILFLLIYSFIVDLKLKYLNSFNRFAVALLTTIFTAWLASAIIIPLIIKHYTNWINKKRDKSDLSTITLNTPKEEALETKLAIRLYLYDFDHKLITHGWLTGYSHATELDHQLTISPDIGDTRMDIPENEIINEITLETKQATELDDKQRTKIYIDAKNKLKYYIIYYDES